MVTINMQKENLICYNQYAKRKPTNWQWLQSICRKTKLIGNGYNQLQKENLLIGNGYNQYAKRKPTNWQWLQSICKKPTNWQENLLIGNGYMPKENLNG